MSTTRRAAFHPPVLSTEAHAAEEAALLGTLATAEPKPLPDGVTIPDSPATLWTSVSTTRFSVRIAGEIPAALRDWVAPPVVVRAHH